MFSTFTLHCPSTLPSQQQTSSLLSSSTFRNCNRLSILASSRDIFGHARASYDIWIFLNPGAWAVPPFAESAADWRLLGDLGSNTLRRFDAIRYIRSRDFPHAALYILHRIATHLPEPHYQACISAIRSGLRFRGLILPGPSRPMLAPFFAHSSFRTLLLTQLRGFVRSTTRCALPFHVAEPRVVFKARRKLSSALFSHLQAAQTWSLGELSCTCTDLAKRHPSLPKHEGHLLFSGSDTHELFDPDIVSMLSGSMRNSFFPPRGVLMNRLTQAFHHWARTNNLPSLDPSTLSTLVDFHFDLHLPLHAHVQQALTTLEPLVRHGEDHADSRLMLYCRCARQDAGRHTHGSCHLCSFASPLH